MNDSRVIRIVDGCIDVANCHDAQGRLYMPSYPWGVRVWIVGLEPTNKGPNFSDSAKTKAEAIKKAEELFKGKGNCKVIVFRRDNGKVAAYFGM